MSQTEQMLKHYHEGLNSKYCSIAYAPERLGGCFQPCLRNKTERTYWTKTFSFQFVKWTRKQTEDEVLTYFSCSSTVISKNHYITACRRHLRVIHLLPWHPHFWPIRFCTEIRPRSFSWESEGSFCSTERQWDEKNLKLWAFLCAPTAVCIQLHFPAWHRRLEFPHLGCQTSLCVCGEACSTQARWQQQQFAAGVGSTRTTENPKCSYLCSEQAGAAIRSLKISVLIPGSVCSFYTRAQAANAPITPATQLRRSVDMLEPGHSKTFQTKTVVWKGQLTSYDILHRI